VRELIAFANTDGGTLLVGIDDNGEVPGVHYPEEEALAIRQCLTSRCRPALRLQETIIPLSRKKFVVRFDVSPGERRPHYFKMGEGRRESFVRVNDQSVRASREMVEILRRSDHKKNIRFAFGDAEKKLMEYLEQHGSISLAQYRAVAGLNRFMASKKLILLVLAGVLRITPSEKGDVYSRIGF
jgi:predicted HTH transcriptional regulator